MRRDAASSAAAAFTLPFRLREGRLAERERGWETEGRPSASRRS